MWLRPMNERQGKFDNDWISFSMDDRLGLGLQTAFNDDWNSMDDRLVPAAQCKDDRQAKFDDNWISMDRGRWMTKFDAEWISSSTDDRLGLGCGAGDIR